MKQPIEHYENRAGGKGTMHIERLLSPEEMGPHVKMYARVTIDLRWDIMLITEIVKLIIFLKEKLVIMTMALYVF